MTNTLAKDVNDVRINIKNNFLKDNVQMCLDVADAYNKNKLGLVKSGEKYVKNILGLVRLE